MQAGNPGAVAIMGAGSIGCYVGGRLATAGATVQLIGRPRLREAVQQHGLHLTDLHGFDQQLPVGGCEFHTSAACAARCALVLVCVKSAATADAGRQLAEALAAHPSNQRPLVISLQNGIGNADVLREQLPDTTVLPGMVPFNVVQSAPARFHQGTEGALEVQADGALEPWRALFAAAGLNLIEHEAMRPVQWAKLLLNLNNAVNALSDLPLQTQLSQRAYRRCVALAQREGLQMLALEGIEPARLTPVPPRWIPRLLSAPDWLFRRLAKRMLEIDPLARSSMWEDLQAGRLTEVDWLNGEIVRLAARHGRKAPINACLQSLVHEAEQGRQRSWSGPALLQRLQSAVAARA